MVSFDIPVIDESSSGIISDDSSTVVCSGLYACSFRGWVDEIRITKGIARSTEDFIPPASPFLKYYSPVKEVSVSHLEGSTVAILADGNVRAQQEVSGGTITLTDYASIIHAGLPYYSDLETLNVEVGLADGSLQGRRVNISRVILRMLSSRGGWVGPDFDNLHELLGDYKTSTSTSLFTDDVKIILGQGYKDGGRFCFRQSDPLPVTILGVISVLTPGGLSQI